MKVAIVSDPLVQRGGAERVVAEIAALYPDAPIFTLLYSAERGPAALAPRIRESWLAAIPGAARRHRLLLPLYPAAVESFDLADYDLIVSSHHTAAKGVLRHAEQLHVCYCHTPMRALWERTGDELATLPAPLRGLASAQMRALRVWDLAAAQRVDAFVANSRTTQTRIAKHYGRSSTVVHPPIDTGLFTPGAADEPDAFYLFAARPVAYKRLDIAIEATRLAARRLVVVGDHKPQAAARHVDFVGRVSDARLVELMRSTRALLFPQLEDFGMTPLEVMACGRPVIAFDRGGASETVVDGTTGVLVAHQDATAFAAAIARFETLAFDRNRARAHAESFGAAAFRKRFVDAVRDAASVSVVTRSADVT